MYRQYTVTDNTLVTGTHLLAFQFGGFLQLGLGLGLVVGLRSVLVLLFGCTFRSMIYVIRATVYSFFELPT